ncbi:hypothetical protein [Intestinibacter sp.]
MTDKYLQSLLYYGEEVRPVQEFSNYWITNLGRVFSSKKRVNYKTLQGVEYECIIWKELKIFYLNGKYKAVTLTEKGNKRKNVYIAQLVYETFIGKYDKHFYKVCYKDRDTENCNLSNLYLDIRNKTRANLLKYTKQKALLKALS